MAAIALSTTAVLPISTDPAAIVIDCLITTRTAGCACLHRGATQTRRLEMA
jgi:hypothetical protein